MKTIAFIIAAIITALTSAQTAITAEDMTIWNNKIQLIGTLSFTETTDKQPLIIFVSGSGNPDRNGNQLQMNIEPNYIKMLCDSLNQKGIASFRYDKRNVTNDNHKYILKRYVFTDLVDDVRAIIKTFASDERFNEIILLGHSQGSLVSIMAINKDVDKFISLAGLGQSADKAIVEQLKKQSDILAEAAASHLEELRTTGSILEVNPFLTGLFARQNLEFLISYIKIEPEEEIRKVSIPTLILNGDRDSQVTVADAERLYKAKPDARLIIIKNMNHVLKHVEDDAQNMDSYYNADVPLADTLIETITAFIKQ